MRVIFNDPGAHHQNHGVRGLMEDELTDGTQVKVLAPLTMLAIDDAELLHPGVSMPRRRMPRSHATETSGA